MHPRKDRKKKFCHVSVGIARVAVFSVGDSWIRHVTVVLVVVLSAFLFFPRLFHAFVASNMTPL